MMPFSKSCKSNGAKCAACKKCASCPKKKVEPLGTAAKFSDEAKAKGLSTLSYAKQVIKNLKGKRNLSAAQKALLNRALGALKH
jgi:hypothetical protein